MSIGQQKKSNGRGARIAVVLVGLVAVAALGYLLLISPKRSEASELDREIAGVQAQIDEYRATPEKKAVAAVKAAELFKLAKAMPDATGISGVMLEVSAVASDSGIVFDSITPQTPTAKDGYQTLPISVVFRGNFYSLSDFLYRLRNLVQVRDGELAARGRLFSVSTIQFGEGEKAKFPNIEAQLTIEAFVFGGGAASAAEQEPAQTATTSTQSTSTTTSPTTTTGTPLAASTAGGGSGS